MRSQTKMKLLIAAKATSIGQFSVETIEIIENLISQNFDEK